MVVTELKSYTLRFIVSIDTRSIYCVIPKSSDYYNCSLDFMLSTIVRCDQINHKENAYWEIIKLVRKLFQCPRWWSHPLSLRWTN